jgi:hypothetical protein
MICLGFRGYKGSKPLIVTLKEIVLAIAWNFKEGMTMVAGRIN